MVEDGQIARWQAVARIHQSLFTGLLLRVLLERGVDTGAAFLNRTFHAQHDEKFLPALKTLGLDRQPDAVACAQFFYLANMVGGVKVGCMVESERKAWIRYPPPRWAYMDASICAVPNEVTIAMMRGFHARCGESLANPRLGFVCTGMTSNGDPGLEGYFVEEDYELTSDQRLRFALGERGPAFDPQQAPKVDWDEGRMAKAQRNYALNYIRQMLPAARSCAGDELGQAIAARAAKLVGLQLYDETVALLGGAAPGAEGYTTYLAAMLAAGGDKVDITACNGGRGEIVQTGWRMMAGTAAATSGDFRAWSNLWQGACASHDASLAVSVEEVSGAQGLIGERQFRWTIAPTSS